jgi:hypothetical protein
MPTVLIESYDGTIHYIEADPRQYILNFDINSWCHARAFKYTCFDALLEDPCPVCLDPVVCDDHILKLFCQHTMHLQCAEKWFTTCIMGSKSAKCPLCNLVVLSPVFENVEQVNIRPDALNTTTLFSRFIRYVRTKLRGL